VCVVFGTFWCWFGGVSVCCVWDSLDWVCRSECVLCVWDIWSVLFGVIMCSVWDFCIGFWLSECVGCCV
jgi:hypothetical protein